MVYAILQKLSTGFNGLIIVNYANADMVGHTGNQEATIKAIECLDNCIQKIWDKLQLLDGQLFITADHGNAEQMFNELTQQKHTAHTTNPVPFLFVAKDSNKYKLNHGGLCDIAPTILYAMQ